MFRDGSDGTVSPVPFENLGSNLAEGPPSAPSLAARKRPKAPRVRPVAPLRDLLLPRAGPAPPGGPPARPFGRTEATPRPTRNRSRTSGPAAERHATPALPRRRGEVPSGNPHPNEGCARATTRSRRSDPLPPRRFRALLTPLSRFFSPFRRRTCSLSASPTYLALDETYHPIRTALSSGPTLRCVRSSETGRARTGNRPPCLRPSRRIGALPAPSRAHPSTLRGPLENRGSVWASSASLAATKDVPVGFFSSG